MKENARQEMHPREMVVLVFGVKTTTESQNGGAFMEFKHHVGVDYHKKYSYIVVKDNKGEVLKNGTVMNTKASVQGFLEPYLKDCHGVLEATRNWTVMHDWLEEMMDEVILANPLKVKAIAEAKIKTDKIDANILSDLLRVDLIPEAHVPSLNARRMRLALRERMFFVRLKTMVKNRIVTIFDRYPEERKRLRPKVDIFEGEGLQQLKSLEVSDLDREIINRELEFIDQLKAKIKEVEETIKRESQGNGNVTRLKSLPGVGEFLARLIDAEIDGIDRFYSAKKLAAYAGLVPSTYSSGGKTFHGRIIKRGNKWLRWAFVEAVWPAIRKDKELREEYERFKSKKGSNKAKVVIARKLLTIAYKMLKEGRNYYSLNQHEREYKRVSRLSS